MPTSTAQQQISWDERILPPEYAVDCESLDGVIPSRDRSRTMCRTPSEGTIPCRRALLQSYCMDSTASTSPPTQRQGVDREPALDPHRPQRRHKIRGSHDMARWHTRSCSSLSDTHRRLCLGRASATQHVSRYNRVCAEPRPGGNPDRPVGPPTPAGDGNDRGRGRSSDRGTPHRRFPAAHSTSPHPDRPPAVVAPDTADSRSGAPKPAPSYTSSNAAARTPILAAAP